MVDAIDIEGNDRRTVVAVEFDAVDFAKLLPTVFRERFFVLKNAILPDFIEKIDGCGESVCGDVVGRSGLEFEGQSLESRLFPCHAVDHLAATLIRRQFFEPFLLAVEYADARRTVHFMAAEGQEIAVERLHVEFRVGRTLGRVNHHGNAVFMGDFNDFFDGILRSEYVADMRHADEFRALGNQLSKSLDVELEIVGHRDDFHDETVLFCLQLPRHDVRVMLHFRHDDFIVFPHLRLAKGRSHEVDGLGRAACKDDFLDFSGIDELPHTLASRFVQVGGLLAEIVNAPMHVGIGVEVFVAHRIEHAERFLRRGGVVEIDERMAVDFSR